MRALASVADEFMVRFMEKGGRKQRPHSPRYIAETRRNFANHVLPVWGDRDIKSIARREVIKLLDDIADDTGPIAANRTRAALSTMFNWALRRDLVEANPVAQTEPPGQEKARDRVLSDDEIIAVWNAASELGYPFGGFVQVLLATGQRTKARREHVVPLSAIAMQVLEECGRIGDTYVFTTRRDRPINGFFESESRARHGCRTDRLLAAAVDTSSLAPHLRHPARQARCPALYHRARPKPRRPGRNRNLRSARVSRREADCVGSVGAISRQADRFGLSLKCNSARCSRLRPVCWRG
jgi:integrase